MRDAAGPDCRRPGRLPPFGADVLAARRRGESVNLFVYVGAGAWRQAGMKRHAIPIANADDWRTWDWRLVDGLGITLVARGWGSNAVEALATHLVRAGASPVSALEVSANQPVTSVTSTVFRRKERSAS